MQPAAIFVPIGGMEILHHVHAVGRDDRDLVFFEGSALWIDVDTYDLHVRAKIFPP